MLFLTQILPAVIAAASLWFIVFYKVILPRRLAGLVDKCTGDHIKEDRTPKFPFGNFVDLTNNPWETLNRWMTTNGLKLFWLATEPFLYISDAEVGKNILSQSDSNFKRSSSNLYILKRIEGNGIIWTDGEEWKRQHRILARSFTPKVVKSVAPTVQEIVDNELIPQLNESAEIGKEVDVMRFFQYFAMKVIIKTSIGGSMNVDSLVDQMIFLVSQMNNPFFLIPGWQYVPTPHNRKVEQTFQQIDSIVYKLIAQRRLERVNIPEDERGDVKNLLDMMLDARDSDENGGSGLNDTEIRDNIMTFIFAGSDTTATSMAWFFVHLSRHREALDKLRREIDHVTKGQKLQVNTADQFPFYQAVVSENMRLTPPFFICVGRTTRKTEQVGDWAVPKGVALTVSIEGVGRNPKYWDDPHDFRPERFLKENSATLHPFTAIPFGAGRRFCLGKGFALSEMHIVLVSVLQHFDFEMVCDKGTEWDDAHLPVEMEFPILHPKETIRRFKFSKRQGTITSAF
eukprot:TRINITY_DN3689_c0_g1_i5.p2 TRINITY_DN3689_c0_g1~~TRINITY_DN3689_c0_g1_i5.p2  ORF type:complete len:513 (+),score=118.63 TRINITY_DN3689_c0_g1_i5:190-1728(+)